MAQVFKPLLTNTMKNPATVTWRHSIRRARQPVAAVQAAISVSNSPGGHEADGGEQCGRQIGDRNLGEEERGAPHQVHGTEAENELRGVAGVAQTQAARRGVPARKIQ